jgi:hypothetical protein
VCLLRLTEIIASTWTGNFCLSGNSCEIRCWQFQRMLFGNKWHLIFFYKNLSYLPVTVLLFTKCSSSHQQQQVQACSVFVWSVHFCLVNLHFFCLSESVPTLWAVLCPLLSTKLNSMALVRERTIQSTVILFELYTFTYFSICFIVI